MGLYFIIQVHIQELLSQTCHVDVDATWDVIVYDQCTEDPGVFTTDNFVHVLLRKLATSFNSVNFLSGRASLVTVLCGWGGVYVFCMLVLYCLGVCVCVCVCVCLSRRLWCHYCFTV